MQAVPWMGSERNRVQLVQAAALGIALLASAGHANGQESPAPAEKTCELRIWETEADKTKMVARRQAFLAQLQKYESLKAETERRLQDMPPSKQRDDTVQMLAQNAKRFDAMGKEDFLHPYCALENPASEAYMQEVVQRIEECGTRNFPKAHRRSVYGATTLTFVLDRSGEVASIKVRKESGKPVVDQHAIKVVLASAPFGPVPQALHEEKFDRFLLRPTFNFRRDENSPEPPEPKVRCAFQ